MSVLRGIAGCLLTTTMSGLGVALGGWVGWKQMPPKWDPLKGGSEFHGLGVFFEQAATLFVGVVAGAMTGMLLGMVLSIIFFWPRKTAVAAQPPAAS